MNAFSYISVHSVEEALKERGDYLAGGTNLIDHLKLGVETPDRLIDIRKLGLDKIEPTKSGVRIGSGVTNSALAYDKYIQSHYPALSKAILAGASPQLRNVATTGGNLLQRTRCYYFRDVDSPCNKREPGSGCSAIGGLNRIHALLGTSDKCIATHPSDMAVAMAAFEASVVARSAKGERTIPLRDFYVPYGVDPAKENVLEPGELIVAVELPATPWFTKSTYVKARDRASYEFALSSAAVALDIQGGTVRDCRIALGGVATMPWRAFAAENALKGRKPDEAAFRAAAEAELKAAVPQKDNAFKIELCKRVIVKALQTVATGVKS